MRAMNRYRMRGLSIIELMISLAIGMFVIAVATSAYISSFGSNASQIKAAQLNNELRNAMTQLSRDVRRHGYSPTAGVINASPVVVAPNNNIVIQYQLNDNAAVINSYDYRLENGGITLRVNGGAPASLTNPITFEVTQLQVTPITRNLPGGDCINIRYEITIAARYRREQAIQRAAFESVTPRNEIIRIGCV